MLLTEEYLHTVLKLRFEEVGVMFTKFVDVGGTMQEYCVWGPMNPLREGDYVTLDDLVEFNQHLATEHEIHISFKFNYLDDSPWTSEIHKIYPQLWYDKSTEHKEALESLTGMDYDKIPPQYFSGPWVADKPFHAFYRASGTSFTQLQIHLLLHLVRIATNQYRFPAMIERKEKASV